MLKNLKIGQRLGMAFAAVLILLAGISAVGMNGIGKTFESVRSMYAESVVPLSALSHVEYLTIRNRVLVMDMILHGTPENVAKRNTEVGKNIDSVNKSWKEYIATNLTQPEKDLVKVFEPALTAYQTQGLEPVRAAMTAGNKEEAEKLYETQISRLAPQVFDTLSQLKEIQVRLAKEQFDLANSVNRSVSMLTWIFTVVSILLGVFFAWWITKSITGPMDEALKVAQTVAAGDLTSNFVVKSTDETGQLLKALQDMNGSLQNIVGEVRTGTDAMAAATEQIATGNLDLSARTESQAGALEETASSMEQLTSTVKQNADNARQANQLAKSASEVAIKGGVVVSEVVTTMSSINDSSKKIVDIISVIDGIAFQTNILALNAAVEAARAGEQGRGFAVVASEVRNLAQRSASAAKEIKELIGDSVEKVGAGTRLVDQAGVTMGEIVESIRHVTDIMEEITAASQEQTSGIEQINKAIIEMDNVTQQNAALVEEAAAAAGSLKDQATKLTDVVSVFKLSGGQTPSVRRETKTAATSRAKVSSISPKSKATPPRIAASTANSGAKPVASKPAKTVASAPADGGEWDEF